MVSTSSVVSLAQPIMSELLWSNVGMGSGVIMRKLVLGRLYIVLKVSRSCCRVGLPNESITTTLCPFPVKPWRIRGSNPKAVLNDIGVWALFCPAPAQNTCAPLNWQLFCCALANGLLAMLCPEGMPG